MNKLILFEEIQKFRQWQLWISLIIIILAALGIQIYFICQLITVPKVQWIGLSLSALVSLSVSALLFLSRLEVNVSPEGLKIRFFPLEIAFQNTAWKDIVSFEAISVKPLRNYGGWGIRLGLKSKAYIVTGNQGLLFRLQNGKTLFVGSQESKKFEAVVASACHMVSNYHQK